MVHSLTEDSTKIWADPTWRRSEAKAPMGAGRHGGEPKGDP
jgi:hypothetical protein